MNIAKILLLTNFLLSVTALARPTYFNELQAIPGVKLTYRCQTCHGGNNPKALNAFGKDFRATFFPDPFNQSGQKPWLLPKDQQWKLLMDLDSDGDGVKNYDELKAGTNPGVR